ncbi:MAG: GNAT family N-acetyltransferase [Phycisphaerae bacterium]|nr:GNAT family N-acetyltransferase [Phycisphaerae bacterium]
MALLIPSSGRTAMFFVSPPAHRPGAVSRRAACIEAAARCAAEFEGERQVRLAQAIVDPEQTELVDSYLAAGFVRLADLAYLRRPIPLKARHQARAWPRGISVTPMTAHPGAGGEAMLLTALEASYEGTLDCAALCGVRDVRDVLESHLSVGQHDPALWYLVRRDQRPVGCMLLSPCAEQQTVELVYLGLSPEVRGMGLGRALLEMAIDRLGGRPERTLACAVDLVNAPALALYRAARFRQFAVRVALIRALGG